MGESPDEIDVDELVERIRTHAITLIGQAKYWEIRIHGGDGRARIEVIQQTEPVVYRRPRGGTQFKTRK